ncbi:MAG: ribosome silencing factor [Luteitalea sp.]|nr:ribosome silencing factor [Luteitalea sp.]
MTKIKVSSTTKGAQPDFPLPVYVSVEAALDKKATDLTVLDLRHAGAFADFFVLCSAANARQVKAIVDLIEERLREHGVRPSHIEGYDRAEWVLIDCFDLIIHVFTAETRTFYRLERLWGSATRIDIGDASALPSRTAAERSASLP